MVKVTMTVKKDVEFEGRRITLDSCDGLEAYAVEVEQQNGETGTLLFVPDLGIDNLTKEEVQ